MVLAILSSRCLKMLLSFQKKSLVVAYLFIFKTLIIGTSEVLLIFFKKDYLVGCLFSSKL